MRARRARALVCGTSHLALPRARPSQGSAPVARGTTSAPSARGSAGATARCCAPARSAALSRIHPGGKLLRPGPAGVAWWPEPAAERRIVASFDPPGASLNEASAAPPRSVETIRPAAPARKRRFVPEVPGPDAPQDRHPGERAPAGRQAEPAIFSASPTARFPRQVLPRFLRAGRRRPEQDAAVPGHAPSGALFRSRGPDSTAGIVAECHWSGAGRRLSSGSFPRCGGAGGGDVAGQYPRGMNVAPIGIFASGRGPLVKRCGEEERAGSGPGILPWPAPPHGGAFGSDADGPSPGGRGWPFPMVCHWNIRLAARDRVPTLTPQRILRECAPLETRRARS